MPPRGRGRPPRGHHEPAAAAEAPASAACAPGSLGATGASGASSPDDKPKLCKKSKEIFKQLQNVKKSSLASSSAYMKKYLWAMAELKKLPEDKSSLMPLYLKPVGTPPVAAASPRRIATPSRPRVTLALRNKSAAGKKWEQLLAPHWKQAAILNATTPKPRTGSDDVQVLLQAFLSIQTPKRAVRALERLLDKPIVVGAIGHWGSGVSAGLSLRQQEAMMHVAATCKENHQKFLAKSRTRDAWVTKTAVANTLVDDELLKKRLGNVTSHLYGMSRRIITKAALRHARFRDVEDEDVTFALVTAAKRCDATPEAWTEYAAQYWEEETKPTANARDVLTKTIDGVNVTHQRHILEVSQEDFYRGFNERCEIVGSVDGPLFGIYMCFSVFKTQRPFFVRSLRRSDRTVCACINHLNITSLVRGLQSSREKMMKKGADISSANASASVSQTLAAVLCPKPENSEYFNLKCVLGECPDCGPEKLFVALPWEDATAPDTFSVDKPNGSTAEVVVQKASFEYVEYVKVPIRGAIPVPGEPAPFRNKLALVNKCMHPANIVNALMERSAVDDDDDDIEDVEAAAVADATAPKGDVIAAKKPFGLRSFIRHQHTMLWQANLYKRDIDSFPEGTVIIAMDFAENHSFLYKDETQSLHWSPHQASIFVMVLYRHYNADYDGPLQSDSAGQITRHVMKDHIFCITDDPTHDPATVEYCIMLTLLSMFNIPEDAPIWRLFSSDDVLGDEDKKLPTPNKVKPWSDGAPTQFKSAIAFANMAMLAHNLGIPIEHNFFCSNHGKGEHDGAGANLKHEAARHNLKSTTGLQLKDAADLVEFAKASLANAKGSIWLYRQKAITLNRREFHLIPPEVQGRCAHNPWYPADAPIHFPANILWQRRADAAFRLLLRSMPCW